MPELLIDTIIFEPQLLESQDDGITRIRGVFQRAETKNANGRVYGRKLWERLLQENSPVLERVKGRAMVGHLEHPPDGVILIGALNSLARLNRLRKAAGTPPYNAARLLSPRDLKEILDPHGQTRIASTTFVPSSAWLLPFAPVMDAAGRLLRLPQGAFVVGRVSL